MNATHTIETPRSLPGAIAMIRVRSDTIESTLEQIGIRPIGPGSICIRNMMDIDSGVVAPWGQGSVMLMPHGGPAIVRAISNALVERGVPIVDGLHDAYPEARDIHEVRMLHALSKAASPMAVELLLDQPRRWRQVEPQTDDCADDRVLSRLISPPMVVVVGRTNIGKSSLLNALAGNAVALVADATGTTRDHVGVLVELGGLVVRWIDTPGMDASVVDDEAVDIAIEMVRRADLVVLCRDGKDGSNLLDPRLKQAIGDMAEVVQVVTRVDRGVVDGVDGIRTSVVDGAGREELVAGVRDALVPPEAIDDPRAWRFWGQ